MEVSFIIPGEPVGKGRPRFTRCGQYVKTYTPEKTENYEIMARLMYKSQCHNMRFQDDDVLSVVIECYFSIPKSESKKRQDAMVSGEIRPKKKPDVDNIVKIVLDALNGVAFRDDAQVVECTVEKRYSRNPRVEVKLLDISVAEKGD